MRPVGKVKEEANRCCGAQRTVRVCEITVTALRSDDVPLASVWFCCWLGV